MTRGMGNTARWWAFVVGGVALCVATLALSPAGACALGLAPGVIGVLALARRARRGGSEWALLAGGVAAFVAGDAVWAVNALRGAETAFPGPADAIYLLGYPLVALGILRLGDGTRRAGWVAEAGAIVLGAALPLWFVWAAPTLHAGGLSPLGAAVSLAYPLGDLVLLAAVAPLALAGGLRRRPAAAALLAAVLLTFAADVAYNVMVLAGTYTEGGLLDVVWLVSYVLFGAAALHPAGARTAGPAPAPAAQAGPLRTTLLSVAVAAGPLVLVATALLGEVRSPALLVAASVAVALLASRGGKALPRPADVRHALAGPLVAAPAVVLVMAGGVAVLQDRAREREHGAYAALAAHESVQALRAHERDAAIVGRLRPDTLAHVVEHAAEADAGVAALAAHPLAGRDAATVQDAYGRYRRVADAALAFYRAGNAPAARRVSQARVDPAFDRLDTLFNAVRERNEAGAAHVQRLSDLASFATLAFGLLFIVLLLVTSSRAQQAAAAAATLRGSEERLRALVGASSDLILVIGDDLVVRWAAASLPRVAGHAEAAVLGRPITDFVHPDDVRGVLGALGRAQTSPSFRLRHADGSWLDVEATVGDRREDPVLAGWVVNLRDVTDRTRLEARLHHQAFHDHLTGLANRALVEDRLGQALRRAERDGRHLAVVFCDLDDFKDVNDSLGHEVGDELLVAVAGRIAGVLRETDTLARVGGDEFLLLLEDLDAPADAERATRRVLAALRAPVLLAGEEHVVRASMGVAAGGPGSDPRALLRDADTAMYAAKRQGGGDLQLFAEHMGEEVALRLRMRSELELGLEREQFVVHYQPIVALGDGSVGGFEALVRWQHPERGMVPPNQFIPLAEQTGLIVPLGAWVLETACAEVARRRAELGRDDLYVSVNLAGRQLARPQLPAEVAEVLAATGLPATALLLEVTESSLIDDVEASARRLEELRALGVRLAIDDFGTGYSALNYLRRFPMDVLKIDRSFVRGIGDGERDDALVGAIVAMATSLGLTVVAEGIEEEGQRARLGDLACGLGQGFLFSRPVPASELGAVLAAAAAGAAAGPPAVVVAAA